MRGRVTARLVGTWLAAAAVALVTAGGLAPSWAQPAGTSSVARSEGTSEARPMEVAESADLEAAQRIVGDPAGPRLTGDRLSAETQRVAGLLRCPVCQGLSVADSPAPTAVNMRHQVRDLLAAGYVEKQILAYFERSYGEFVLFDPPARGVNWSLWLAPVVGLLVGAFLVGWMLRAPRPKTARDEGPATRPLAAPAAAPAEPAEAEAASESVAFDPLPQDQDLARYVLRVRELAYGWPGGVRPGKDRP